MDDMIPEVYDLGEIGIELRIPVADGVSLSLMLTDDSAEELIKILQNKLNGRWHK